MCDDLKYLADLFNGVSRKDKMDRLLKETVANRIDENHRPEEAFRSLGFDLIAAREIADDETYLRNALKRLGKIKEVYAQRDIDSEQLRVLSLTVKND